MINILQHLDVWTSAVETRSTAGRGSSNKLNLYGIKKLRELILELAVRGQLVPQNPDDEPASRLLEKIAAEKARLIKDGKLKKQEPLPPITDDEKPFELPKGWEWCRWNEVAKKIGDIDHKMPEEVTDGIPYVSPRDFYPKNRIDFDSAKKISKIDFDRLAEKIQPQRGDIIFPRYGTIGENMLVETDIDFLASYSCCVIKTMREYIAPKYQFILSISNFVKNQSKKAENKTTQANVGIKSIQCFVMPIPPEAEQHRIVAKINELMSLCDALEQEQAANIAAHQTLVEELLAELTSSTPNSPPSLTLPPQGVEGTREKNRAAILLPSPLAGEGLGMGGMPAWARIATHFDTLFTTEHSIDQLKQTILQLAVMGKLVPQDPNDEPASVLLQKIAAEKARLVKEKIYQKTANLDKYDLELDIPSKWVAVRIGDICPSIVPNRDKPKSFSGKIPWVTLSTFSDQDWFLDMDKVDIGLTSQEAIDYSARVVPPFSVMMSCIGRFGLTAINKIPAIPNQQIHVFIPLCGVSPIFLSMVIKVNVTFLDESATSTTLKYLNKKNCENIQFGLPPLAEQHRIVAKVDELMALCDAMKAQIRTAQTTQLQLAEQAMG